MPFHRSIALLVLIFVSLSCTATTSISPPRTFTEAKKIAWRIYGQNATEFYCGCRYSGKTVDLESCGYVPRKNEERASRIEWEHIVPAWVIGHQRQCWQAGGRKNCSNNDPLFQAAEADLHNLVPSIGEINGDRSHFSFGWLSGQSDQYGQCQTMIDFKERKILPRKEVRGAVARTYFYMSEQYGLSLSKQDQKLFMAWDKAYPPSEWEIKRNQKIACAMGRGNRFVGEVKLEQC